MKKSKKLSEQNAPPSLLPPTLLMGLSYGEQSLCRVPPSPFHPHNAFLLQFLYIWGKRPHLLHCGSISFTLTRRSLVLVPSLFRSSAVVNFHYIFCVQSRQACWARAILGIFELEIAYSLNFLITIDLKLNWEQTSRLAEGGLTRLEKVCELVNLGLIAMLTNSASDDISKTCHDLCQEGLGEPLWNSNKMQWHHQYYKAGLMRGTLNVRVIQTKSQVERRSRKHFRQLRDVKTMNVPGAIIPQQMIIKTTIITTTIVLRWLNTVILLALLLIRLFSARTRITKS